LYKFLPRHLVVAALPPAASHRAKNALLAIEELGVGITVGQMMDIHDVAVAHA
jgi:hypothetical protein